MKSISLNALIRLAWGATLLTLPVTSFRWFPFMGAGALVRPLALYPLALLFGLLIFQAWQERTARRFFWTGAFTTLGIFVLFAIASASFGALLNPIPLRGQIYSGRVLRALLTLGIGLAFFVSAVWMNKSKDDLRFTARWILAGLCLDLAWSGLQAVTFYTGLLDKEMVTHWQRAFSMRELVRTNRISGLAYEPAWLASQLATIFIPWLFASLMTGYRLFRRRWLEPALLALALLTLLATYSRGGILVTAASLGLTILLFGRDVLRNLWRWFINGFRARAIDLLLRLGLLLGALATLIGAFAFLSQKDYFSNLWNVNADSFNEYMVDINAGARGAYSVAALGVFQQHPWTGVGLGASGFYIYPNLPDWSLT
ncbi:MAG: O-antigen ligase family protein, partial [Anaerolineales bacterium]|nr:O-antigen ligase family protein [Anaerolineales bacterium]